MNSGHMADRRLFAFWLEADVAGRRPLCPLCDPETDARGVKLEWLFWVDSCRSAWGNGGCTGGLHRIRPQGLTDALTLLAYLSGSPASDSSVRTPESLGEALW